jgi:type II secretory pathway component GspD/PulD (secretin)
MRRVEVLVLAMFILAAVLVGEHLVLSDFGKNAGTARADAAVTQAEPIGGVARAATEAAETPAEPKGQVIDMPATRMLEPRLRDAVPLVAPADQPAGPQAEPTHPSRTARPRASDDERAEPVPAMPAPYRRGRPAPPAGPYNYPSTNAPIQAAGPVPALPPGYLPTPAYAPAGPMPADERETAIYHLLSVPANNIAGALNMAIGSAYQGGPDSGLSVVPESVGNTLVLRGMRDKVEQARRLLEQMDRPSAMVRLEVEVVEVERAKAKKAEEATDEEKAADKAVKEPGERADGGTVLLHAAITTLDNQAAEITLGRTEPQIQGVMRGPNGQTNSVGYVNVGTTINLTPRIGGDAVMLSLDISDSRTAAAEEGVVLAELKDAPPVRAAGTQQFKAQTTVRLEDGKPLSLGGIGRGGKPGKEIMVTLSAQILRPSEPKEAKAEEAK